MRLISIVGTSYREGSLPHPIHLPVSLISCTPPGTVKLHPESSDFGPKRLLGAREKVDKRDSRRENQTATEIMEGGNTKEQGQQLKPERVGAPAGCREGLDQGGRQLKRD